VQTGKWLWTYRREVPSNRFQVKGVSNPLVVKDTVFVGFSDGTLVKVNAEDGGLLAVKKLSKDKEPFTDVDTDPLLVDGMLLVASFGNGLKALNPDSLEEIWHHQAKGVSSVCTRSGVVYFTTANSKVCSLRVKDGSPVWRFNAKKGNLSRPVLAGDWLLVSSSEQSLLVLDGRDGHLLQIFNPGKGSSSPPLVAGPRVFWISNGQILYALGLYS
jgi:outer membrane protein assembly factor BamB